MKNEIPSAGDDAKIVAPELAPANATASEAPKAVCPCEIHIRTAEWDAKKVIWRVQGVEMSDGHFVPNPVIAMGQPEFLATVDKYSALHPTIHAKTPSGRSITIDLQECYERLRNFKGTATYRDPDLKASFDIPVREISQPLAYATVSGATVFTECNSSKRTIFVPGKAETKLIYKMLKQVTAATKFTREALLEAIATSDQPELEFQFLLRLARAYHQVQKSSRSEHLERAEIYTLLTLAPTVNTEEFLETYDPIALSKRRALDVMKAYHSQPGCPPPIPYKVSIRL